MEVTRSLGGESWNGFGEDHPNPATTTSAVEYAGRGPSRVFESLPPTTQTIATRDRDFLRGRYDRAVRRQPARTNAWRESCLISIFLVDFSTWLPLHFSKLTSKSMFLLAGPFSRCRPWLPRALIL